MTDFRVDIYSEPHKELRTLMFDLALLCTKTDFSSNEAVDLLAAKTTAFCAQLKKHAYHEETYAHPIIAPKMSSLAKFAHHHHEHENEMAVLEELLKKLAGASCNEHKQQLGKDFYRKLNRFVTHTLEHLDEEEESLETLWRVCSQAELFAIMIAFASHELPQFLPMIVKLTKIHLDESDRQEMWSTISMRLGAQVLAHSADASAGLYAETVL